MEQEPTYVGIDVAKAQVDVALHPTGERWVVSYDEPGIPELVSQLKTIGPAKIVLEATGGLGTAVGGGSGSCDAAHSRRQPTPGS